MSEFSPFNLLIMSENMQLETQEKKVITMVTDDEMTAFVALTAAFRTFCVFCNMDEYPDETRRNLSVIHHCLVDIDKSMSVVKLEEESEV